jgi:light-harvesting complex II chlorophyll a/b binding protein 4
VDAGKVELDGSQYLGFTLPFSISQLVWIEALLVGGAEVYRNGATDLEERIYPGARRVMGRVEGRVGLGIVNTG